MKRKEILRLVFLYGVCMLALPGLIHADIYLKYRQRTEAFEIMGQEQPARESMRETWIARDMIRTDEGPQTMIMRIDKQQVYLMDNQARTYSEFPMDMEKMAEQAIEEDEQMTPEEKQEAKDFVQGMMDEMSEFSIAVEDTGETKKMAAGTAGSTFRQPPRLWGRPRRSCGRRRISSWTTISFTEWPPPA